MPDVEEPVQTIAISGISDELLSEIDKLAEAEDRSRSSFIRKELERAIAERKKKEKEAATK